MVIQYSSPIGPKKKSSSSQEGYVDIFRDPYGPVSVGPTFPKGGSGGSGRSTPPPKQELPKSLSAGMNLTKEEARRQAELRRQLLEQRRNEIRKIASMKAAEKQKYLRQQAQVARGTVLLDMQKAGKKLSAGGQRLAEKAYQYYGRQRYQDMVARKTPQQQSQYITQRKTGSYKGTPTYEFVVTDQSGNVLRRATQEEAKKIDVSTEEKGREMGRIESGREKSYVKVRRGAGALETAKLSGYVALGVGVETIESFKQLPSTVKTVVKNPKVLKEIPSALKRQGSEFGFLLKTSPTAGLVKVGAEIFALKGTDKAIRALEKASSASLVRLNPKFIGVGKTGKVLKVKTASGIVSKLKIVGKIPRSTIAKQVSLAGKRVSAISSQADKLVGFLRRSKQLRKSLGEGIEETLGKKAFNLLKKYDSGKRLTSKQILYLNKSIRKAGSKGLLERSFFADPTRNIRPSRLGLVKEKPMSFLDYVVEDITLKKPKPQILFFEDIKIERFPKSLKDVANKLKKGQTLTEAEGNKLLKFQLEKSGKFKPLGFQTAESEITLPSGEVIKRVKKIGIVRIKGKNVPIIQSKVVKAERNLKNLLKKFESGKITRKEISKLNRKLKKKTGFDYDLSYKSVSKKYLPIKRYGLSLLSRLSKGRRTSKFSIPKRYRKYGKIRYTSSGKPYVRTRYGKKFIPIKYSSKTTKPYKTSIKKIPKYPPKIFKTGKKVIRKTPRLSRTKPPLRRKFRGRLPIFNVYGKSGRKLIRLNTRPLTKQDALSRGAFAIDNTTSKTFIIRPAGKAKKPGILRKSEQNYFNRAGYKLREYRVRRGRKFVIKPKYIERTRYGIDTRGEKSGLSLAKWIKQRRFGKVVKRKRRISSSHRRILLSNLRKARRVLKYRKRRR